MPGDGVYVFDACAVIALLQASPRSKGRGSAQLREPGLEVCDPLLLVRGEPVFGRQAAQEQAPAVRKQARGVSRQRRRLAGADSGVTEAIRDSEATRSSW